MRLIDISKGTKVAYFSMEVGFDADIPTYSGGLGILAGDTLRSGADLNVPMVGVTLLHRKGYFDQTLDARGSQSEGPVYWRPEEKLEELSTKVSIRIEGREVNIAIWRYNIEGISGHKVPIYFLDTGLKENSAFDKTLTDHLYGGDHHYRLCQEVVLGIGGVLALRALGYNSNLLYHMNEGHSAFLTLALIDMQTKGDCLADVTDSDLEKVRSKCIFTTHTPVPAGHDKFHVDMLRKVLGSDCTDALKRHVGFTDDTLNMTELALFFSRYINGVAMRHGEVSRTMFPDYPINAITNGVHAVTWTSPAFRTLFDAEIEGWRFDNIYLRYAMAIPREKIQAAHLKAKKELFKELKKHTNEKLDLKVLTLGIARRATPYKRLDLIFSDIERLVKIAKDAGPLQIIYSGKAHPKDEPGKEIIRKIYKAAKELKGRIKVVFIENYEIKIAKLLCSGVDLWINTPLRPREASGTSGMKAALNGVPSFSVYDGWWVEGHVEGITGWTIGKEERCPPDDPSELIDDMYEKLEKVIIPAFYDTPDYYAMVRRSSIAFNGSFFNTQRMVGQYLCNAYFPVTAVDDKAKED
ncbi:MAG: alpha-glucan family phosphorylase [Thermodesulfobacteriota bacterium]